MREAETTKGRREESSNQLAHVYSVVVDLKGSAVDVDSCSWSL